MPKISIVTVCLNVRDSIRETIESVLNQTYWDIEYVIMDGLSNDGTKEIIEQFLGDSRIKVYFEKDSGIFNAMNKALNRITGDYVIFMNSGDVFYDKDVLTDIAGKLDSDIVYGDVYRRMTTGNYIQKYKGTSRERFVMMMCGLAFCHQSQFTKTSIMREYGFDESHRITADYDFIVRAIKRKLSFKHVDRIICSFDNEGGVSAQKDNYLQMIEEDDRSIKENFPVWYYLAKIPKGIFRKWFR